MELPDPQDIEVAEDVVLQFGKYKDKALGDEDIPSSYILWLAENHDSEFLCTAADTVYRDRCR